MAGDMFAIMQTAQSGFAAQEQELGRALDRHVFGVTTKSATGTGDIGATAQLGERYRLAFVRCHFTGSAGTAPFHVSVDSGKGVAHDARLFTVTVAGTGNDVHLRVIEPAGNGPSPWTFQPDDSVRIDWTNPDPGNITWGLEIGLAPAW
jgi:hypothetical protein